MVIDMKNYTLKHKDKSILYFTMNGQEISDTIINKDAVRYLPLPLKRIIHNMDEFIKQPEEETFFVLNEEGNFLVDNWLSDREIPLSRDNYNAYIKKGSTARQWMLENNAMSFTDCYWVKKENDNLTWKDICQKLSEVDHFVNVQDENRHYKGTNATLGGQLEKFWYKENDILKLCKKNEPLYDILSARELIASLIYERQGLIKDKDFCKYEFVLNSYNQPVGVSCNAFTDVLNADKNIELITVYDLLEEYNLTQQESVYDLIPVLTSKYGFDEKKAYDYLDMQTMVDFLILNRDRHQGNIAFLRDGDTLMIESAAPIFDSGSCKMLEAEYTENLFLRTKVNGLYNTDGECLSHVKNVNLLDISKLPDTDELMVILNKCENISEARKKKLIDMYKNKINYLLDLQRTQGKSNISKGKDILSDKLKDIVADDIIIDKE